MSNSSSAAAGPAAGGFVLETQSLHSPAWAEVPWGARCRRTLLEDRTLAGDVLRLWSARGSIYKEPSSPWRPEHKFLQPQQGSPQLRFASALIFLPAPSPFLEAAALHWPLHSWDVLNVPTESVQTTLYFTSFNISDKIWFKKGQKWIKCHFKVSFWSCFFFCCADNVAGSLMPQPGYQRRKAVPLQQQQQQIGWLLNRLI